jgi:hypothetical protein
MMRCKARVRCARILAVGGQYGPSAPIAFSRTSSTAASEALFMTQEMCALTARHICMLGRLVKYR